MTSKSNIICLGLPTYEGDYLKSTVLLMNEMTRFYEVYYVEYTHTLFDILKGFWGNKNIPFKRILGLAPRLRNIALTENKSIKVLTLPPILPINWIKNKSIYQYFSKLNAKIIEVAIKKMIAKEKINKPLIINAFQANYGLFLSKKLNEKATIYYCYDEISQATWCKKHGIESEKKFMQIADAVVVSSKALLETKKQIQANTFLVKNGVDTHIFSQHKKDIEKQKKVIGYIGSIDDRIDLDLLKNIVASFPTNQFWFIGRVVDSKIETELRNYKNVKFLGSKQPHELATLIKKIDVGLIPFLKNEFTRNIYPLKINEYLASGMPVISTDFADLSDFEDFIYQSNTIDFGIHLSKALEEKDPDLIEKRIAFAKENSWQKRANELNEIIKIVEK